MKRMTVRNWIYLGLGGVLGAWLASCGGGGTLCHAQTAQTPAAPLWMQGTAYSPEDNLEAYDALEIRMAASRIDLAAFSLTDAVVVNALVGAAAKGIRIRIYLDRGEVQAECRGDSTCARIPLHLLLNLPTVQVKVKHSKVLMHLKSYEIDGQLVRDGSANFSEQGERNQDNSATFAVGAETVSGFEAKFKAMWFRPDNLTVAQAVETP